MTVLVTGGTGNTGAALAALLTDRGVPVRIASRRPGPAGGRFAGARFDWADPATHGPALDGVDAVYLLPPPATVEPLEQVGPFLDVARAAGVRRVVLLGALAVLPGAPGMAELVGAVRAMPEWAVLRPSGFMQNFTGQFAADIARGEIRSAAGPGRVGWIDTADIAAVAARTLLDPDLPSAEHVLTGPEALDHDEVARTIAEVTGRPVRHVPTTTGDVADRYRAAGLPDPYATALAGMDDTRRAGSEDVVSPAVRDLAGRPPRSFRDFVRAHRRAWG
ncbi:NAD(P)H-binding protein [Saccharopolyspora cebuensis]|uniref:NAD(P)H-binding protein n=1 Tax=Saccharopolyspora cebuensis TaxID=418759 RepID=A0ABV4CUA5_9PSEU